MRSLKLLNFLQVELSRQKRSFLIPGQHKKNRQNAGKIKRPNGRFYYLTVVVALRLNFHTSSPEPLTNGRSLP